eukprot:11317-Heterococcus_DN1.PRE.1
MQLGPAVHDAASNSICVTVPPTRSDVLHAIDIMEDVAIAYGYNALPLKLPSAYTVGRPDPLNAFSDLLREEVARAGYTELLTHGLCDRVEVEGHLRVAPGSVNCVTLSEADYEVVRTTLLPGVLKTLQHNRGMSVKEGVRMFECHTLAVFSKGTFVRHASQLMYPSYSYVCAEFRKHISDVVLQDATTDTGARNVRRLCALYAGPTSGFEIVHGLADRLMQLVQQQRCGSSSMQKPQCERAATVGCGCHYLRVPPAASYAASSLSKSVTSAEGGPWRDGYEYFIQAAKNPTFFPGRCADVMLRRTGVAGGEGSGEMTRLGTFGILHPEVLHAFDIGDYPASALEWLVLAVVAVASITSDSSSNSGSGSSALLQYCCAVGAVAGDAVTVVQAPSDSSCSIGFEENDGGASFVSTTLVQQQYKHWLQAPARTEHITMHRHAHS